MRVQRDRFLEMVDRRAEKPAPYEQAGIGTVRLGAFWVALQCALIAEDGLVVLPLHLQNRAEAGMGAGRFRVAFQRLPVACRGRVLLSLRMGDVADAAMRPAVVRLKPQHFLETTHRLVVPAETRDAGAEIELIGLISL